MSDSSFKRTSNSLCYAIGISAALSAIPLAQANDISLYNQANAGNVVLINGAAGPTIGTNGIIGDATGIATGTIPTFGLDLGRSNVTTDGTYTFAAAFVVYEEDTQNLRLEISIPTFTLTFAGGTGSLSFPGGSATVYGRDSTGTITANDTISNAMFSNPSGQILQMDIESQLTALTGAGAALFTEIANVIKSDGVTDYVYKAYLIQKSGPVALGVGVGDAETDPANFTEFGCASSANANADFVLNTGLRSTFTGGYAIQGLLGFTGSGLGTAPSAYTSTCTPTITSSGGGGGGGSSSSSGSSAAVTQAEASLAGVTDFSNLSTAQKALVKDAVTGATSTANTIANNLRTAQVSNVVGINALSTINTAFRLSGNVASQSSGVDTQSTDDMVNLLNSAGDLINSLEASAPLLNIVGLGETQSQEEQVASAVTSLMSNLILNLGGGESGTDVAGADLSANDAQRLANAMSTVLSGLNTVAPDAISDTVVNEAKRLATVLANKGANTEILTRYATAATPTVSEIVNDGANPRGRRDLFQFSGTGFGLPSSIQPKLDLINRPPITNFVPFFRTFQGQGLRRVLSDSSPAGELIEDAIGGSSVRVDDASPLVEIRVGDEYFATEFIAARFVSSILNDGVSLLPDGSALVVNNQLALIGVPTARDMELFASTLNTDFAATVAQNNATGGYILENPEVIASVTFAFEPAASPTSSASGPVTLSGPEAGANPADPSYKFTVHYGDGSSQSLLPFPIATNLIDSLEALDVLAIIDRSTGVMDLGDGLLLKPDYFVTNPTPSEALFLSNDGDEFGIAFTAVSDLNGDGTVDYKVISDDGVQILWGVP